MKAISKTVRKFVHLSGTSYPIKIVQGYSVPTVKGEAGHYATQTGKPVYYPNAYRRAWGKPVYVHSTIRIEVGQGWLEAYVGVGHPCG